MRPVTAALTLVVAIGLSARTGSAAIDPATGIAGIEIGMTANEVIAAKGTPDANRLIKFPDGTERRLRYGKTKAFFPRPGYNARPWQVTTTSPAQRTNKGAGVGWTEERLRTAINRLHCGNPGGFRICTIGRIGRSKTIFYVSKRTHRVTRVSVFR